MTNDDTAVATKSDIQLLIKRFDRIDKKFESIDHKFESIDHKFESIDHKFESIDKRLSLHDEQFLILIRNMDAMHQDLVNHINAIGSSVDQKVYESEADTKQVYIWPMSRRIEDHEKRIQDLEKSN